jgi:methylmalonyl-CoA mutase cobalamin-binding subunit
MLAQLLAQRGVAARRIPHTSASRETIAQADFSDVTVIAVSYLELAGAPAHLRYLLRRLRQRVPGAVLIPGLWPQEEAVINDVEMQKALGADRYVISLGEAIEATLKGLRDRPASDHPVAVLAPSA